MRARRELRPALAASALAAAAALFLGGGAGTSALTWIGGFAVLAVTALVLVEGLPGNARVLAPLAGLAAWCALSIAWSQEPDRSWDYANRAAVYLAFAALGLYLWDRTRELALGLAALLGAVAVWALAGKVFPGLYADYGRIARLRSPVGYWNALALLGCFALPLALWLAARRRVEATLLAYAWLVAIALTYSRGGAIVAVLVVAAWIALTREWVTSGAVLARAGLCAAAVVALALAFLPGVIKDGQPHHARVVDGALFGVALVAGAAVAAALARVPDPAPTPRLRVIAIAAAVLALAAGVGLVLVVPHGSGELGNGAGRLASPSSNHRSEWWDEARHAFTAHPVGGTGAGSFLFTHLRLRGDDFDYTTEPHNVPLQFLAETGIVGFALFAGAFAWLIAAARRRERHELALALILPAYLAHSIVDIDWDYVALGAPVFLVAGALAGRAAPSDKLSLGSRLVTAGVALAVCSSLVLPWLGGRWTGAAEGALDRPARAVTLAKRARSVDPLSVEPVYAQALAEEERGHLGRTLGLLRKATRMQPQNADAWFRLGSFDLNVRNCPRAALPSLERFVELDSQGRGGEEKQRALRLVNSGKPIC